MVEKAARQLERDIDAERADLVRRQAFADRQANGAGSTAAALTPGELARVLGAAGGVLPGRRSAQELDRLQLEAERLTLTQASLAETRVNWNDRSTKYTTAIALLAVALFLVGFALVSAAGDGGASTAAVRGAPSRSSPRRSRSTATARPPTRAGRSRGRWRRTRTSSRPAR
ncbi:MAG TPA: hypothetical protein VK904_00895 [Miltoncostaeaceae bacterium]|nr:hypothetical protein [Miltoncostaeaceae bacterium]